MDNFSKLTKNGRSVGLVAQVLKMQSTPVEMF